MEQALYLLWRVNLRNLVKNKLYICREWHIQPSEIDKMIYFEYEQMLKDIQEFNKEQEKQNKQEQKQYNSMMNQSKNMQNYSNMYKNAQQSLPSLPKVHLPKF